MDLLLLEKDSGILNLLSLMGGEEGKNLDLSFRGDASFCHFEEQ